MTRATAKLTIDHDRKAEGSVLWIEHTIPDAPDAGERRAIAKGYHYAHNPETGLDAVFLDGETVPEWAWPENQPDLAGSGQ